MPEKDRKKKKKRGSSRDAAEDSGYGESSSPGDRGGSKHRKSKKKSKNKIKPLLEEQPYNLVKPLSERHQCVVCHRVLHDPHELPCGHRACVDCLSADECPEDGERLSATDAVRDEDLADEINNLDVKCKYSPEGCDWKGKLMDHEEHLSECDVGTRPCPNRCGQRVEQVRLQEHLDAECLKRMKRCDFCEREVLADAETEHWNECARFPVECPNSCGVDEIPREELEKHIENDCTKAGKPCPFEACGCDFKGERHELKSHIKESSKQHLTQAGETIGIMMKLLHEHQNKLEEHQERIATEEKRVANLEKLYGAQLLWRIDNYTDKMQDAKTGRKQTIFSPPFMTSRHGYKLAMSACLNGDGKGKGRYMSLFVCICKGDYDSLLPWPFTHKLCFTLIDQNSETNKRRNITYLVKPNPVKENAPFLGRPLGERNASFGAQKFVELSVIRRLDYVKDDTMFVAVNMDLDDVPLERPAATATAATDEMEIKDNEIITN